MATEAVQQEGLLDEDMIYVIMKDDYGHITVEGCYVSEQKAELRLAVLDAERELAFAKAREKFPDENLDHNVLGCVCYWIIAEKLIR